MLDEIGEMKPGLQGKLLHVLQDGDFSRLGSNKRVTADVRVIAATNRDLESMLPRAEFREDLYYRLRVIEITVPPLRERIDELHSLLRRLLDKRRAAVQPQRRWPGNIRELENVVKRFVILQDERCCGSTCRPSAHAHAGIAHRSSTTRRPPARSAPATVPRRHFPSWREPPCSRPSAI